MMRLRADRRTLVLFVTSTLVAAVSANYVKQTEYTDGLGYYGLIEERYPNEGKRCSSWLLLPGQNLWNANVLRILYFLLLCWCFLGVAIVADLFMGAIEVITSRKVTIEKTLPDGSKEVAEFLVWNPTIANLSLMALGSSAPEILLSVIGAVGALGSDEIDELGPGTIVGSAAFNLLFISAICVMAIPDGEGRFLADLDVFAVTATASVFAYLWLYIVLAVWSPDYVSIAEAFLTFLFFPLLLGLAFMADKGVFRSCKSGGNGEEHASLAMEEGQGDAPQLGQQQVVSGSVTTNKLTLTADREALREYVHRMKQDGKKDRLEEQALAAAQAGQDSENKTSYLKYRLSAARKLQGKQPAILSVAAKAAEKQLLADEQGDSSESGEAQDVGVDGVQLQFLRGSVAPAAADSVVVGFRTAKLAVLENVGVMEVHVVRDGPLEGALAVHCVTRDGTATAVEDYEPIDKTFEFAPGQAELIVPITIVDDDQYEPDEEFYLEITEVKGNNATISPIMGVTTIEIIDDDKPGNLSFEFAKYSCVESAGFINGCIIRRNGADGIVACELTALDDTAIAGVNYVPPPEPIIVEFRHHQTSAAFSIPIIDTSCDDPLRLAFTLKIDNPQGGATITSKKIATVEVTNDDELIQTLTRLQAMIEARSKMQDVGTSSWVEQFEDAVTIKGSVDEVTGEETKPSSLEYTLHFFSIFWKVLFACVPPTSYGNGWPAFGVAVIMIGMLTAVIGEIASLFGCAIGLKESITAITFVALGTSLPDTFASAQAAQGEDTADSAIGNVTGSNAVNVFLGLGLPWVISSCYWAAQGDSDEYESGSKGYYLPAGSLSFSVMVFLMLATSALLLLLWRNFYAGGMLGGKAHLKKPHAAILIGFWFTYIILASIKASTGF